MVSDGQDISTLNSIKMIAFAMKRNLSLIRIK